MWGPLRLKFIYHQPTLHIFQANSITHRFKATMGSAKPTQPLRLVRMTATDFSEVLRPCNRRGGDLCPAPIPLCWPVPEGDPTSDDAALQRLEYSFLQQKKFFDVDPTCHFVKVVTENGEIASFARWHFYPRGYDYDKDEPVEAEEFVPEGVLAPEGPYQIELYRKLRWGMMRLRSSWQPKGPSWGRSQGRRRNSSEPLLTKAVLMAMVTRDCYRKQGAARMIVRWGVEQASKDRVPAFLEASAMGKPVYEGCGFKQVGELLPWDLRVNGQDIVFKVAKMAWHPEEADQAPESDQPAERMPL